MERCMGLLMGFRGVENRDFVGGMSLKAIQEL
jgi:hypothetical protein